MIRKPFFTVDGVDGVGKSSAIQLAKKLRPELFVPFKCPPDELNQFRGVFDAREVHLGARFSFYAAADFYLSPKIRKVCETDPVCCDRFVLSTVAYHNVLGRRDGYTFTDFFKTFAENGGFLPHTTIVLIANEEARCARLAGRDQTQNTHRDVNTQLTSAVQTEFLRLVEARAVLSEVEVIDSTNIDLVKVADKIIQIITNKIRNFGGWFNDT